MRPAGSPAGPIRVWPWATRPADAPAADRVVAYASSTASRRGPRWSTGSREEAGLRALGWVDIYVPTDVLAVRLADCSPIGRRAPAYGWSRSWSRPGGRPTGRAGPTPPTRILLRMFWTATRRGPSPARMIDEQPAPSPSPAATSAGTGWVWPSIWTREDHRRRAGRPAMMIALGHWAARRGARYGYLQVASANQDAITAYERLGFVPTTATATCRPWIARRASEGARVPAGGTMSERAFRSRRATTTAARRAHGRETSRIKRSGPGRSGRSASGSSRA